MLTVRNLRRSHDRQGFDCGNEQLNTYLRTQASQDVRRGDAVCYILSEDDADEIYGFFTLSNWLIDRSACGLRSAYPLVSATLLGRLAVSKKHQSKGYGKYMLSVAVAQAIEGTSGSRALVVHAKDDQAKNFYLKNGFVELEDGVCVFLFGKRRF